MSTLPDTLVQPASSSPDDGRAGKMETMGRLLGGVAHDFANLVTLISGYSEILLSRIGENDPLRPELEEIHNAANRGARLTSQLLGYTRGQVPQPKAVDLNEIVVGMERMLHPIIGEHVEFRTILDPALRHVFADAGQMEQVLMNLILNARDAVPMGGCITVETTNRELGAANSGGCLPPGAYATVGISDTGRGIDPQSQDRIFEPFFTTKPEGKGTGLGLNIALNIVKEAGGAIRVSSTPGAGAIFTVYLPCAPVSGQAGEAPAARVPEPEGSETILLVEDDEGVRRLLATTLARRGFRILDAAGPREALELFAEHGAEICLVLTDMVMPGMNGRELVTRLQTVRPELKVVYMSGYTNDVLIGTGALRPGMAFMQKPLRPDTLAAKIRETLDSPSLPFNPI
jgi:CheY-like chemotaxis protein